jgi:hypothetical protein
MDHTNERDQAENDDLEQRFRRFLANPAIPLEQRGRMACSLGAVFGALMGMSGMFGDDVSTDTLAPIVRKAARDMLTVPPSSQRASR